MFIAAFAVKNLRYSLPVRTYPAFVLKKITINKKLVRKNKFCNYGKLLINKFVEATVVKTDFKTKNEPQEAQAVSELKATQSIMVLTADKGRITVVLEKLDYEQKVQHMFHDDRTYEKLNKDQTANYTRKLVLIVTRLKDENKIIRELYSHLYPTSEKVP